MLNHIRNGYAMSTLAVKQTLCNWCKDHCRDDLQKKEFHELMSAQQQMDLKENAYTKEAENLPVEEGITPPTDDDVKSTEPAEGEAKS